MAMFMRILRKSIRGQKAYFSAGLVSILMGATLFSALLSLSVDMRHHVGRELRRFGANLVLMREELDLYALDLNSPVETHYLPENFFETLDRVEFSGQVIGSVPFLYALVRLEGQRAVLVGTDFDRLREVKPWWQIETGSTPFQDERDFVWVGERVAEALGIAPGDRVRIELRIGDRNKRLLPVTGIVRAGGSEDNQVFAPLRTVQSLSERPGRLHMVELSVLERSMKLEEIARRMEQALPGTRVDEVQQIARAEGKILDKIQWLMALVTIIAVFAALTGLSSTVTASVMARENEIGLMRSLGARSREIARLFFGEAAFVGFCGGLLGFVLGFLLAEFIGNTVFDRSIGFHGWILPVTFGFSLLVVFAGSCLPVRRALRIDPTQTLRGE